MSRRNLVAGLHLQHTVSLGLDEAAGPVLHEAGVPCSDVRVVVVHVIQRHAVLHEVLHPSQIIAGATLVDEGLSKGPGATARNAGLLLVAVLDGLGLGAHALLEMGSA